MKEFHTKAIINASADLVWRTLTDSTLYPEFDPNCLGIEGAIKMGNSLKIRSKLSPNRVFKVTVSELKPQELMIWESGLPLNLFTGKRTFSVLAKDDQTTEFHMSEIFSGYLVGLFANKLPDMNQAFAQFSRGLKGYIESR